MIYSKHPLLKPRQLTRKCVEMALGGDTAALRLCLEGGSSLLGRSAPSASPCRPRFRFRCHGLRSRRSPRPSLLARNKKSIGAPRASITLAIRTGPLANGNVRNFYTVPVSWIFQRGKGERRLWLDQQNAFRGTSWYSDPLRLRWVFTYSQRSPRRILPASSRGFDLPQVSL